ncbi:MAG: substrate-binding domain-containing protein [Microbacterium sp.]|uniref:sugar ABC transporter substrate-binding protein n=1 Tax=Microbacterium sp. TaxID=51671 RepID=UPI0026086F44|nr:substrate-binding domain-containing protein [Microbacterium sp.]MCX6502687.1 substrate-binding domain-containing protein [Microbacterium sp.]
MKTRTHRFARRGGLTLIAVTSAALALAGCASSTPAAESSSSAASGESENAAYLETVTQPAESYPVPTDPIEGVDAFAGGTVFYVPITLRAPTFAAIQSSLQEALSEVGITVQSCPADGSPANIASCVDQAIAAGALGVIADAIPYQMGAEAFTKAREAGLPVIITDQGPNEQDFPADESLAYIPSGAPATDEAMLRWIAEDSNGEGVILVSRSADGYWSSKFMSDALEDLPSYCPGCTVAATVDISTATQAQLQSNIAAELISNPDIGYLITDFAQYIPQATGAIQDSGRTDVKFLTGSGTLGAIEGVKAGQFAAVAAEPTALIGYRQADTLLRLLTGTPVAEIVPGEEPIRLFTADTLPENLTDEAALSGEWFGPTSFKKDFVALWQ